MDSGTLSLYAVGILWALFALWVWTSLKFMENASKIHGILHELHDMNGDRLKNLESRLDATQALYDSQFRNLEQRTAGVEALLVSTVGQETEDFCRQMDAIMDRMEKPEEKQEQKEKLTLSEEFVGKFGKKGGAK